MGRLIYGFFLGLYRVNAAKADDVPDLAKTPGAIRPGLTKAVFCRSNEDGTNAMSPPP